MRVGLFGVLALLALAGPLGCVAPLPPTPTYLNHEWWWQDDEGTRTVQPLGHAVQSGCYPYNRVLDRKGVYQITTLQHKNPTVFRDQQIRLRKPDGNFIKKMVALPACADIHLPDNGAVGCGYNYYRPGLTPQLCKLGKGSVAKVHALSSTDPAATRIDCRYADATPYDTSTAPASGNVQLHVLNNYIAYPNVVQQYNRTGDPYYISDKALNGKTIQLTSMLPVAIPDRTGYKCGDGTSCNWSEDELFQIGTQTWTGERTVLAKGGPFFLIPVGGKWWMRMTATVFENAAGRTINKRHLIIFDDDIRQASPAGLPGQPRPFACLPAAVLAGLGAARRWGEKGTVWRNKTGEMDHEHVELDLKAGGDLSPGWHS
ncbi:hypothetical protein CHLNCDRAFT_139905 [Chlorella variabilis]|uniref:Uncharacterized protein n=1 Tax=Chlorella variabilis TaxID=554065 RepID=E1ZR62_CHLVA|nr:hypothetical protein CHLNCDRAFT_139905 [Chlorella variabilis]EFN51675.1 hypothetical protein CHLNCDRAFT_139905 [Chlorella variabilis]|eukprot:XP_005843777.1 hypothetical protein CHLNCDRAFT_139905 [Chlorella variabilis]